MNLKTLLIVFLLILEAFTKAQYTDLHHQYYRITAQTSRELTISFEFDELSIRDSEAADEAIKLFDIPGLSYNYIPEKPLLPVLILPLALPEEGFSTKFNIQETESFPGLFPLHFQDHPNDPFRAQFQYQPDGESLPADVKVYTSRYPEQFVKLEALGLFRDYRLTALKIYPVQVTGHGVIFYKKFTITITFQELKTSKATLPAAESRLLKNLVANKTQLHLLTPRDSFNKSSDLPATFYGTSHSTADSRVRLIIDAEGIYQITGEDLLNAGINIDAIDLSTLRLTNKAKEVAFYIVGDQDNRLDPEDFFEFWGEPNYRTFFDEHPDLYSDPFADENVYWLEWNGKPSVRMVEENGSLVSARPGSFNASFFYQTTLHFEENRHFDRLGQGSLEQLSYTRDLWFYDSGVKAISKRQYPFMLVYPDQTSFNKVKVAAMFSGKTFGARLDGIRVPHSVMVWLNNGFVGAGRPDWFDQDTSRITNFANSNINNADLLHGQNVLEVQLPVLPDITVNGLPAKGTDIVLLNWFEVTYDRLYKAYQNQINFRRPSFIPFPNVDLFQFEIDNFTRPDIDIYKKGISKIINFKINAEEINDTTFYKITFQDNVLTDDIEYIALTNDQKKKPLRIEQDEPVDPEDPNRVLKDPRNTAEYLIITHQRFYENARELLQFRREQGVAAELVNVQDIYDEFNYGIKSPLAIRDFLRYVFFNWNRNPRLKYVVLLGDSNFDYKSKSQVAQDFVPTFFFQTREFGAAASDLPYSLISGEDNIPDIFIGRIPASSNSDVANVILKIKEYEESAPVGPWRNQSLFISGNDANTFELQNILGRQNPAFRSQNSRVIESLLPSHLSASRLNTIRDTDLPPGEFDPNFGTSADLLDYWDNGLFLINFMGHGGGGIWADVQLMDLPDVDRLNNKGMYPFVTSMTCFTGAFENPTQLGLAQKMLLVPDRGAIGVLASSGLGYLHNDYSMLWYVGQFLFDRELRIGDIVTLGKILYLSIGGQYNVDGTIFGTPGYGSVRNEMIHQYNLIGDPYTRLQFTPQGLQLETSNASPQRGDTLEVTIRSNITPADGYVELVNQQDGIEDRIPIFGAASTTTLQLVIPENFQEGAGLIRAYLAGAGQDASGQIPIGINHAIIRSVEFQPPAPDVDDSVYVNLRIEDPRGVKRVYLFREGSHDTLPALPQGDDSLHFVAKMEPTFQLQTVLFNVHVENNLGNTSIFRNLKYVVSDIRPDIALIPGSLRFSGSTKVQLKIGLENTAGAGEDDLVRVGVSFYDGLQNFQQDQPFATRQVELTAADSTTVQVDFPLDLNRQSFDIFARASVDPGEALSDFNPANNTASQTLRPLIYNITPANGSGAIVIDSIYQVMFQPGGVSDSTAVLIQRTEFLEPQDQPALTPIPVAEPRRFHALKVQMLNPEATLLSPYSLKIRLNPALFDTAQFRLADIKLYEKTDLSQPWTFTEAQINTASREMIASSRKNALFAPFVSDDPNAPQIELTADGLPLKSSGLVSNNPSLHLIIQDESGVNLQKEKIIILLDGNELADDKTFIPDSIQNNNALGITLFPELSQGKHNLEVIVQDVNGNAGNKQFELIVSDNFDIRVYGNYPNPFKDRTIFSYFVDLNDDLDKFEILIFTVSGRRVKRIDSDINNPIDAIDGGARRKGYNELIWDGTDEEGNEVANGVYFALVRATYQEQTIEKILKVAKLK